MKHKLFERLFNNENSHVNLTTEFFDEEQIYQIYYGLDDEINVSLFAKFNRFGNPVFDWLQMEQIYYGLEDNIDVYKYSQINSKGNAILNWKEMDKIRIKLILNKTKFNNKERR